MIKLLNILLAFTVLLINDPVFAQSAKTGKFDEITTNSPSKTTIDLKKNVDMQSTGGAYIPSGSTAQRPSPTKDGMIRYNTTLSKAEIYSGGDWKGVGGGNLAQWITATNYALNDTVIESNKIYICAIAHTSSTFSTDLLGGKWTEISATDVSSATGVLPIANGGTGSSTQNFVDLTNNQTIAGTKTFSNTISGSINGNAATVTTNANLTGPITSVGNTTSVASQTGAGSKFVMDTSPTISAPTISGHPTIEGVTATGATGTGKIVYDTSPTLVTPNIGAATGYSLTTSGNISATGTITGSNLSGTNTGDLLTKSDKDGSDVTTTKLTAPYGQLSTSATGVRNIDTGNLNMLSNSSFRVGGGTVSSVPNWTLTTADANDDGTYLTITPTSAGGGLKQTVTTNAAYVVGGQGAVYANVKTLGTDVYVCPLMNGSRPSDVTKYCGKVPVSTTAVPFPQVIVPFIMDGTSNGIEIYSTGTSAFQFRKTIPVFVGQAAPFQGVSGAKLVGTVTVTGCANQWTTTSTTLASFSTQTGCTYTTTGQAQAPSTNIPAIKFASLPAGDYRLEYEGLWYNNTNGGYTRLQFTDGTNTAKETSVMLAASSIVGTNTVSQSISYSSTQSNVTLEIKGSVTSATTGGIYGTSVTPGVIKVWYFPPESKIYSDFNSGFAENAGEIFYTGESSCPAGSIAGDGSAISRSTYSELFKKFGTTYGVGDGSTTFNLPDLRGIFIRGAGSQTISSILYSGTLGTKQGDQVQGHRHNPLTGTTYMMGNVSGGYTSGGSFNTGASTTGDPTTDGTNGTPRTGSETRPANISLTGCIRTNNRNITGSFAGIEKCANDYECTDSFSATVASSGAVSNQNIPWISSCTNPSTGQWDCTLLTNLKDGTSALSSPLKCNVTSDDRNNIGAYSGTTTVATFTLANRTSGATNGTNIFVDCQKGTNDYKPKTAKVATSIGVPTVPGISTSGTGNSIDSFAFSFGTTNATTACSASPCSYLDQIGDVVSSVTRVSSGSYTANFTKTYTKLKCVGGAGSISHMPALSCSNCNTLSMLTSNASNSAVADSFGTVICTGSY